MHIQTCTDAARKTGSSGAGQASSRDFAQRPHTLRTHERSIILTCVGEPRSWKGLARRRDAILAQRGLEAVRVLGGARGKLAVDRDLREAVDRPENARHSIMPQGVRILWRIGDIIYRAGVRLAGRRTSHAEAGRFGSA